MTAGELLIKLGFETDTMKLNEFIKDLGELNLSSVIAATGLGGMVKGLEDILRTADEVGSSFNKLAGITGVAAQKFEQWENIAKQANVTAGLTSSTIADIQKHIGQMKFGDPFAIKLQNLFPGLQVMGRENDPAGVYRDLLKIAQGMTLEDARDRFVKAGINTELLLERGYLDQIDSELTNSKSSLANIVTYHTAIGKLSEDWKITLTEIGGHLAPIVTFLIDILDVMIDKFEELSKIIPDWMKDLIGGLVVLGLMAVALDALIGIVAKLTTGFIALGIARVAAMGPVGWAALGVGAAGFGLYELLKPKDANNSNVNNGGDVNMNNNYNINGNNADDIAKRIRDYQEGLMRDTSGQSRLGYI
jgi:hypothetical protein